MAFAVKLELKGSKYDALGCNYSFHRDVDSKGRPESNVYGGTIKVVVEANDDTNIVARLIEQSDPISGSVTFHKDGNAVPMKTLSWENGYIMKYNETFDVTENVPMSIYFELSAGKITVGKETIDHKLPK